MLLNAVLWGLLVGLVLGAPLRVLSPQAFESEE
jgi:hypothetical protein